MLSRLMSLFASPGEAAAPTSPEERLQVATCVVLLEVAQADDEFSDGERARLSEVLRRRFSLEEEEVAALIELAREARLDSFDLWKFTNQINRACSAREKEGIIREVWRVVYADGSLDGHEDYLMHKLAQLLNLNHSQLIEAKLAVLEENRNA